ncbi:DsrE family protein [Actinotalea ferrariae]|uniref:DsrE family protein n=1 Tax=Actinotalea ferrariae TaxID=1386098 RepID=UPI001C8BC598|nr:DsrE family protein [Actinotalea ferrariae]MBX9245774.1 DsrE family protein [Actinotalea ferrariae]
MTPPPAGPAVPPPSEALPGDPGEGGAARSLVVKTTSGADRPEACNQAFTVAAAAVAAGARVSLWLTGEAAWLALPGRTADVALEHATPLGDLLDVVLAAGTVTVCTQCAARRGIGPDDVVAGVRVAGSATFVEETLRPGAQALVY